MSQQATNFHANFVLKNTKLSLFLLDPTSSSPHSWLQQLLAHWNSVPFSNPFVLAISPMSSLSKAGPMTWIYFIRKSYTIKDNAVEYKKAAKSADLRFGEQRVGIDTANQGQGKRWTVNYDKLVVGVSCYSQTFGTKGVKEHAYFLKDISGARKIRKRIMECFEFASLSVPGEMKDHLLRFAVVGGGPTRMEFAADMHDLICEDLVRLVEISVYDAASKFLNMFDQSLEEYATETFVEKASKSRPHTTFRP